MWRIRMNESEYLGHWTTSDAGGRLLYNEHTRVYVHNQPGWSLSWLPCDTPPRIEMNTNKVVPGAKTDFRLELSRFKIEYRTNMDERTETIRVNNLIACGDRLQPDKDPLPPLCFPWRQFNQNRWKHRLVQASPLHRKHCVYLAEPFPSPFHKTTILMKRIYGIWSDLLALGHTRHHTQLLLMQHVVKWPKTQFSHATKHLLPLSEGNRKTGSLHSISADMLQVEITSQLKS